MFISCFLLTQPRSTLKIIEKVSFNIASEASYVYNLRGQKFIENAKEKKNDQFWKTLRLRSNSVTR